MECKRMTISELIKLLLEQDIGDIADTMRHAEYNKYIQGIMHKQRDTIRRLREDERRTACIIDALCRKIDELSHPGVGKSFLKTLYTINDPELIRDIPYKEK